MKEKKGTFFVVIIINLFITINLCGQGLIYEGPDDPAGDIAAERFGFMDGNRVLLFFRNTTEVSDCCDLEYDVSKWPNDDSGTHMLNGGALFIGARVFLENDTIPVTNIAEIESRTDLDTLYYCQTSYREGMDTDPTGTIEWGLYPVPGYFNPTSETPAMSNKPESWPQSGWPGQGDLIWPGEWFGRFGRGVMHTDLETYFVVNDAQDQEYLGTEDIVKYYPRRVYGSNGEIISDIKIGDKNPDVTIQKGLPWGGLGIRVEQRGFQIINDTAKDIIFFEYSVANISEYDLPEVFVGFHTDFGIGGDLEDDHGYYNELQNIIYSWDTDGVSFEGTIPGIAGFAYLETPGKPYDAIDNDEDGLIDERRDNNATQLIGPYDGIIDLNKFLQYYEKSESDLREHWDADEDQDWQDGMDINGNGMYDNGEEAGDDVGLDGVGPDDINYNGPDVDGTECNHKPDSWANVISEPNFGFSDVDESDMIGLTSFHYILNWESLDYNFSQDRKVFELHSEKGFDDANIILKDIVIQSSSGLFSLRKGRTEKISTAMIHSYEALTGLNSPTHDAPNLFQLKKTAQRIYENDYRFDSLTSINRQDQSKIISYKLSNNYPNPFNPTTIINFSIQKITNVSIKIFDVLGREIAILVDEQLSAGEYSVEFDGREMASGVYFYKINAVSIDGKDHFIKTMKMVLAK